MPTLFLLFSHTLTEEQHNDAKAQWAVDSFVTLPQELQAAFSNVPADITNLNQYAKPFNKWLKNNAKPHDLVLIQGDFGLTYKMVRFCKKNNLIAIYATTERQSIEVKQPDGSVVTQRVFRHKMFRRYFQ